MSASPPPYARRVYPCAHCGHADCRDETHARGCPRLPPVTDEQMWELAESCRRGWEREELARARKRGAAA